MKPQQSQLVYGGAYLVARDRLGRSVWTPTLPGLKAPFDSPFWLEIAQPSGEVGYCYAPREVSEAAIDAWYHAYRRSVIRIVYRREEHLGPPDGPGGPPPDGGEPARPPAPRAGRPYLRRVA